MKKLLIALTLIASTLSFTSEVEMAHTVREGFAKISYSVIDVKNLIKPKLINRKASNRLAHMEVRIDSKMPNFDQRHKIKDIRVDYIKRTDESSSGLCNMYFHHPAMASATTMSVGIQVFVHEDSSKSDDEMIEITRLCAERIIQAAEPIVEYTFDFIIQEY